MNPSKERNRLIEKRAAESWKKALLEDLGNDSRGIDTYNPLPECSKEDLAYLATFLDT